MGGVTLPLLMPRFPAGNKALYIYLVGGFNPIEKY